MLFFIFGNTGVWTQGLWLLGRHSTTWASVLNVLLKRTSMEWEIQEDGSGIGEGVGRHVCNSSLKGEQKHGWSGLARVEETMWSLGVWLWLRHLSWRSGVFKSYAKQFKIYVLCLQWSFKTLIYFGTLQPWEELKRVSSRKTAWMEWEKRLWVDLNSNPFSSAY
jgi:hypothetical protein